LDVTSTGYALEAQAQRDGVELRFAWPEDGNYREAEILRETFFGWKRMGSSREDRYFDRSAVAGNRYRYRVVLLRADGSRAPISAPVEVSVPNARVP
jgi:hypothetical protein